MSSVELHKIDFKKFLEAIDQCKGDVFLVTDELILGPFTSLIYYLAFIQLYHISCLINHPFVLKHIIKFFC